jgi:hypothetical protein
MTNFTESTDYARSEAVAPDDLDELLARFFKSALPQPWPACPQPPLARAANLGVAPSRTRSFWRDGMVARLAVAAALAGLILSYPSLQTTLPDAQFKSPWTVDERQPVGFRWLPEKTIDHTKSGQPVGVEVEKTPDPKKFILRVQELPPKNQKQ